MREPPRQISPTGRRSSTAESADDGIGWRADGVRAGLDVIWFVGAASVSMSAMPRRGRDDDVSGPSRLSARAEVLDPSTGCLPGDDLDGAVDHAPCPVHRLGRIGGSDRRALVLGLGLEFEQSCERGLKVSSFGPRGS